MGSMSELVTASISLSQTDVQSILAAALGGLAVQIIAIVSLWFQGRVTQRQVKKVQRDQEAVAMSMDGFLSRLLAAARLEGRTEGKAEGVISSEEQQSARDQAYDLGKEKGKNS
jgi:hypothetical protein